MKYETKLALVQALNSLAENFLPARSECLSAAALLAADDTCGQAVCPHCRGPREARFTAQREMERQKLLGSVLRQVTEDWCQSCHHTLAAALTPASTPAALCNCLRAGYECKRPVESPRDCWCEKCILEHRC